MGDLSLSRDCPEFTLSGHTVGSGWAVGHGPWPTFEGWTILGHIVTMDLVWMFLGFLYPVFVPELSKLGIP